MTTIAPKEFLSAVKNQYENLPYPYRDVSKEREKLYGSEALSLSALSHTAWGGKRDLREGARFLVAGHGTGDTLIFWAEQLRGHDSEIIGLDLSEPSANIAKKRLAERGLDNVKFIHASLLDLLELGLEKFDVIECGGVLHHLQDPDAGLRALASVLKDDGIMQIMVYGHYGRVAVYMVQEMMRQFDLESLSHDQQVALCKEFLQAIPKGHWLMYNNENFKVDIQEPSGAGIYDLFLHPQDRAYTVPQIYDWLAQADLKLQSFLGFQIGGKLYDPREYTRSGRLHAEFDTLPLAKQHQVAELMHGHMNRHTFYAVKERKNSAELADDMIIHFGSKHRFMSDFIGRVSAQLEECPMGQQYFEEYKSVDAPPLIITKRVLTHHILRRLDNQYTPRQLFESLLQDEVVKENNDAQYQAYKEDLKALYEELHSRLQVFLRHESIKPYVTVPEIQDRLSTIKPHETYQGTA